MRVRILRVDGFWVSGFVVFGFLAKPSTASSESLLSRQDFDSNQKAAGGPWCEHAHGRGRRREFGYPFSGFRGLGFRV